MNRHGAAALTVTLLLVAAGCSSTADPQGSGTTAASTTLPPSPASPSPTFTRLPTTVTPADLSTTGVDPCALVPASMWPDTGITTAAPTAGAVDPTCLFTGASGATWELSFGASRSLAEAATKFGGVNDQVAGATARSVVTDRTCRVIVALTSRSTLQVLYDAQASIRGCNDTLSFTGYALDELKQLQ